MRKIEIGQRFRQTSPPRTAWELLDAVLDPAGIRHLRIRSLDDPTITKLISEPIVDDEPAVGATVSRLIRVAGYEPLYVNNAAAALGRLESGASRFAGVVSDVHIDRATYWIGIHFLARIPEQTAAFHAAS